MKLVQYFTYRSKLGIALLACSGFVLGLFAYYLLTNYLTYDFTTIDGNKHKHSQYEGKVLVINYFAEWCAPCLREIPELNEFHHQLQPDVALFAVSYDALSRVKLQEIKEKYQIDFPIIDTVETPFPFERPAYLPATFLITKEGKVAGQLLGEQTVTGLNDAISRL